MKRKNRYPTKYDPRRTSRINLKLYDYTKDKIVNLANHHNLSLSEFIENILTKEIDKVTDINIIK